MPPKLLYDGIDFDFENPLFGIEDIREINPQRFEMEQLTGIVHIDNEKHGIVGFKDVTEDEFWVRGHMPGFPLMPGVILCECSAQLAGFYARKFKLPRRRLPGIRRHERCSFSQPRLSQSASGHYGTIGADSCWKAS